MSAVTTKRSEGFSFAFRMKQKYAQHVRNERIATIHGHIIYM